MECFKMVTKRNNGWHLRCIFFCYVIFFEDQERQFLRNFTSRNFERFYSVIKTHPRLYIYIYIRYSKGSLPLSKPPSLVLLVSARFDPVPGIPEQGVLRSGKRVSSPLEVERVLIQVISSRIISRLIKSVHVKYSF